MFSVGARSILAHRGVLSRVAQRALRASAVVRNETSLGRQQQKSDSEPNACPTRCVANPWVNHMITGVDLLRNSRLNKGLAFTKAERKALKLEGILPSLVLSQDLQRKRIMEQLEDMSDLEKYSFLFSLSERNEKLFYYVLDKHTAELMPIVYTPVVGAACSHFGHIFRNFKTGLYITANDKGRIYEILDNWPEKDVRAIVFTDGERILGLGDLGTFGMGIPIGKLMLYTVCGGVNPAWTLPVTIDVGTNNQALWADPFYTGLRQPRLKNPEYDALIAEFIDACKRRFGPYTLLQFEDFGNNNAFRLLKTFEDKCCTFNDDIQGTAGVSLAGILGGLPLTGKGLKDHVFVFYGAGEAGIGIANLIAYALQVEEGMTLEEARKNIWLVDSKGLVVKGRSNLTHEKLDYAHQHKEIKKLEDIVRDLKATALIGVCAIPQMFTEGVVKQMAKNCERPVIFALSNPTSKAECTAEQAYKWTDGKAIFASGSPFDPVTLNGHTHVPGQGNNSYIFPGVALAVILSGARRVTDKHFYLAARALAAQVTEADLEQGSVYPPLSTIKQVSAKIAAVVGNDIYDSGLATNMPRPTDMLKFMQDGMYKTDYETYVA